MAIDSAAKRRSAAGVPFLPLGPGVSPDVAKPAAWRQEAAWGYSGIPVEPPVVVGAPVPAFYLLVPTDGFAAEVQGGGFLAQGGG